MVDVTEQVKQDVVEAPAQSATVKNDANSADSAKMHEEFTQALKTEPNKKPGFFARLFGKK
jgi:hypothetical protein